MRAIFLLMYRYELAEYVLVKKQFIQDFFLETGPPYLLHACIYGVCGVGDRTPAGRLQPCTASADQASSTSLGCVL
jgi:hypothetical protein